MFKVMTLLSGAAILGLCVWIASIAIINWKSKLEKKNKDG